MEKFQFLETVPPNFVVNSISVFTFVAISHLDSSLSVSKGKSPCQIGFCGGYMMNSQLKPLFFTSDIVKNDSGS